MVRFKIEIQEKFRTIANLLNYRQIFQHFLKLICFVLLFYSSRERYSAAILLNLTIASIRTTLYFRRPGCLSCSFPTLKSMIGLRNFWLKEGSVQIASHNE